MTTIDELIESAAELAERGHTRGEIADELNVSRETATWLVDRAEAGGPAPAIGDPEDIHVDWSAIGRASQRLANTGASMAHRLREAHDTLEVTVGIEKAGVPLATAVAQTLETALATYAPRKHQWDEGDLDDHGGTFSRNFSGIEGCDCAIVDDTITTGTTMQETIGAIRRSGGEPVAGVVLVDKHGRESLDDVPIYSLIQVTRLGGQAE